jgi:CBS domain-containing protein
MENKLEKIFSRNLITISDTDTIYEADQIMTKRQIRHLPVLDKNGYLVGLLSKSDFIALSHLEMDLKSISVRELMSSPVKTFSANAQVRAVAQLFVAQKINSGLVMDNNEIVGIVTSEDLLRLLAENNELENEIERMDLGALASEGWISSTSLR